MIKLLLAASTSAESSTATTITGGFIIATGQTPPPSAQRRELTLQMETNFEKRYDSDGESPPLADAEDVQEVNEEDNVTETPPAPVITPNSADMGTSHLFAC